MPADVVGDPPANEWPDQKLMPKVARRGSVPATLVSIEQVAYRCQRHGQDAGGAEPHVREIPVRRDRHRGAEQVSGHHPDVTIGTLQLGDDAAQRGADHRLVEGGQERRERIAANTVIRAPWSMATRADPVPERVVRSALSTASAVAISAAPP